jgi:predicted Zn-dependent protease
VAAEQALKLDSSRGINYSVLARAYVRVNRYADAKATALRAMTIGKDSYALHATLFQIAFAESDQAAMSREATWSQGRPSEWFSLDVQALAAATGGKYKQAKELFQAAYDVAMRENLAETADDILIDQATVEFEVGLPDAARVTLRRLKQQDADNPDLIFLNTELGNIFPAERFMAAQSSTNHPDTLMNYVYMPRLRAELALRRNKPLEALAALESAVPYEFAGGFTLIGQRNQAYLLSGQEEKATLECKKILSHQGVDPISPLYPLTHLRLGRIDAKTGRIPESRAEYEMFFADWKDADQDLPTLSVARQEYAALTPGRHL